MKTPQETLRRHVEGLAATEKGFGPASSVLFFGSMSTTPRGRAADRLRVPPSEASSLTRLVVMACGCMTYVEGYAWHHVLGGPLEHSWWIGADGTIVDPSFEDGGHTYFGIPLSREFVTENFIELRDHDQRARPILRELLTTREELKAAMPAGFEEPRGSSNMPRFTTVRSH